MTCRVDDLVDLGHDGLGAVCRHLDLRSIVSLSCASQSLHRMFEEQGNRLAVQQCHQGDGRQG